MELNHKIPNLLRAQTTPPPPEPRVGYGEGGGGNWKIWIFDAVAVILAGATGYSCLLYFSGKINLLFFAVIAAFFLIASFFDFLFSPGQRRRWALASLQILAFMIFFYAVRPAALLSALAVTAVFYFLAMRGASFEVGNSLKFRLGSVARGYMKKIFIGFALAAILLYLPQWNTGNVFVPQDRFQRWYDGFAEVGQRFYSGADLRSNVGSFAESIARTQLATSGQFLSLSMEEQDRAVRVVSRELIANTSKSLALPLTPEMTLADAFYSYLLNLLTNLKTQFGDSFLAAWAVTLFVIVFSLGTLLIWVVTIIAYLLFELLAAFNVVHISGESVTKEVVELS